MFPSPPGDGCPAGQTVMRVANRRLAPFGREQPVGALADPANSAGQEGNFSCFDSVRLDSPERAVLYVLLLRTCKLILKSVKIVKIVVAVY